MFGKVPITKVGKREKTAHRLRRQIIKEGRCPLWSTIRNCSSLEQCNWDEDCSGSQKCCKSTCETRSCRQPILPIGPGEDACPKDESTIASNKENSDCRLTRTRFCFKSNCKRCCFHYSTCNPHREILTSREVCQRDGVRLKVSAAHKSRQVLPAYKKGELRCRFEGEPVSITWKKVGLRGLPNRMIPRMDKLNIQDVDMRDGGMYKCQAYDGFLTAEAEISVIINGQTPTNNKSRMSRADCLQPRNTGYCKRHAVRWYFDGRDGVCRSFAYGGCGGNTNNFETQEACNSACSHAAGDICSLPKVEGLCKGFMPKWFYNSDRGRCEQFVYGGCGGNANSFNTKTACLTRCTADPSANSPCLRRHFEARRNKRLGVFVPRCLSDGSYAKVQCHGPICFCMDEEGEEVPDTRGGRHLPLNCTGTKQLPPAGDLTPCQKAQRENSDVPFGSYLVRCKQDGSYEEVQCNGSSGFCWCVQKNGTELSGTKTRGPLLCPTLGRGLTHCQRMHQEALRSRNKNTRVPQCKLDGSFEEVQCHGISDECWCVDQQGIEIAGTRRKGPLQCAGLGKPLTACQKEYQKYLRRPWWQSFNRYVPRCRPDGAYEKVQCSGGVCYCVTPQGKEIPGTKTINLARRPNCTYTDKLSPCRKRLVYWLKNPRQDKHLPWCRADGSFNPKQCYGSYCYCVNEKGNEIPGTKISVSAGRPVCTFSGAQLSKCQQRYRQHAKNPIPGQIIPRCKDNGSFESLQCRNLDCYCVDENGDPIAGTSLPARLGKPKCGFPGEDPLSSCQKQHMAALKFPATPSRFIPSCKRDGRFEEIQCLRATGECWCVNNSGEEMKGTRTTGYLMCPSSAASPTPCQEEYQERLRSWLLPGPHIPQCSHQGLYEPMQCYQSYCFCVNEHGVELVGSRIDITEGKPKCSNGGSSLTSCQKQLQEAINLSPDPDKFVPRCKYDGSYEDIQCHKPTGKCWCADRDGNILPSTATGENVTCPYTADTKSFCWSRYQQNIRNSPVGSHIPWCRADGSFIPFQVQASQFFCVNRRGEELPGMSVDISFGKPDCRAAKTYGFIATPCQRERGRRMHLSSYVPRCQVDGTYDEVQCDVTDNQCWCVDRDGREINGTRGEGVIRCPSKENLTSCQKRQKEAIERSSNGPNAWNFVPRCRQDGGFHEVQCHVGAGQCWCVDINGNERLGTATRGIPDCSENFTACQRHRARALGMAGNPPPGAYVPLCKPDGSYDDVQCHAYTGLCWCVDESGDEILGTRKWGRPSCSRRLSDHSNPIDLGILIDASDSVTNENWPKMLEYVSTIVDSFEISARGTHVGLIVFSRGAEIPLYFNTLQEYNLTADNVKKVVSNLNYKEGWSRFDLALSVTEEELFNGASGMRNEVPKVLLVLTSSRQERGEGPFAPLSAASQGLRDRDVSIYVIGIGDEIEVPEQMDLASDYRNVFVTSNFNTLLSSGLVVAAIIRNDTKAVSRDWICNLPPEPGQLGCLASITAHYFEASLGECQQFIYSGCGGNANNFPTYEKCMNKCKGVLPSCVAEQRRVSGLQVGHFVPKCKLNGRYAGMQCYRETGYCWCVDEYGNELHGTKVKGTPICSLADGQLDGKGYEIPGTHRWGTPKCPSRVHRGVCPFVSDLKKCPAEMSEQSCSQDSDCPELSKCCYCGCVRRCTPVLSDEPVEISDCAFENVRSLSAACSHVQVKGRFFPKCKVDGSYEGYQCLESSGVCWCVDRDGNEIPGSRQTGKPNCTMQVSMTPCQMEKKRALTMRSRTLVGLIIPSCLSDGSFDPVQCNNMTGFCWCVDKHGSELVGTRQWGIPNCTHIDKKMTVCSSRREECLDDAPNGHFVPHCNVDGSFDDMQCLQLTGECWCVDTNGSEIPGTRSNEKVDCSVIAWLSPCQIQRRQALGPRSVPTVGMYVPECKADGGFEVVQCHMTTGYCWCVDEYGTEVKGSKVKGRPRCGKGKLCKKKYNEILASFPETPLGLFVPQCLDDGRYRALQCHVSTGFCWCVDDFGNELTETRVRGRPNCSVSIDHRLTLCQSRYNHVSDINERGRPVPLCERDGSFKTTQCNSVTGECWCVDEEGNEKPETRKVGDPNCEPKDAETNCQLLPDRGKCEVFEPAWFFNNTAGVCAVFIYGGCEGNANRFTSYDECQAGCHGRSLTYCELQREINTASSNDFIPRCKDNGDFEPLQCHLKLGECWCVDESGIELPDSRTAGVPDCSDINGMLELNKQHKVSALCGSQMWLLIKQRDSLETE
ncbi:Equistatin [Stylophora pistillata]|uniref:Equistatin n=1 Tax=Stylophora pistillata TaxID=50429 RepID=A0A2B4RF00_STYPI|nr:Equistatin [Stylophora pistillata]